MVCKNRGIYDFLGLSRVLITYNICPPGNGSCFPGLGSHDGRLGAR